MLFLATLIFRGVAIELRNKEEMYWWRQMWDVVYSVTSVMLAFLLGIVLQGIAVGPDYLYEGAGFFEFLNPYSLLTGISSLLLFMTHDAIYLVLKTEGRLFERFGKLFVAGTILFVTCLIATGIYTMHALPHVFRPFSASPSLGVLPLVAGLSVANTPRLVYKGRYRQAFVFSSLSIATLIATVLP